MSNRRRSARRLSLIAFVACFLALAAGLWYQWPNLTREPVGPPEFPLPETVEGPRAFEERVAFESRFLGHTEASIIERFGPPDHRHEGRDAAPTERFYRTCPEAVCVVYSRPTGWLRLWYCREQDRWVCFSAFWNPEGMTICRYGN
jgi:hypothetical protein